MSANLRSSKRHPPQADSGARPSTSDPPKIKLEVENIPPLTLSTAGLERERKAKARLQVLLDDEWVRDVTTTEVVCGGCQRTLKLSKQTLYEASSWKRHRSTCERIAEAEGRPIVKGKSHAKGKGRAQQVNFTINEPGDLSLTRRFISIEGGCQSRRGRICTTRACAQKAADRTAGDIFFVVRRCLGG
jgi:hypothetical protein